LFFWKIVQIHTAAVAKKQFAADNTKLLQHLQDLPDLTPAWFLFWKGK
jgi:hypothetical protein